MFPFLKGILDQDEDRLKQVSEEKEALQKQVDMLKQVSEQKEALQKQVDMLKQVSEQKEALQKQVDILSLKLQNISSHMCSHHDSDDALQKFIDTANIPICGFNADLSIVQFNARAEEIMKVKKYQVIGEPILEAFPLDPISKEHVNHLLLRFIRTNLLI